MLWVSEIRLSRTVDRHHLALPDVGPERAVLVSRGVDCAVVMRCPDGCGDILTVNLDPRSGPAWRLYGWKGDRFSLFPSVWRTSACRAHFIVWHSEVVRVPSRISPWAVDAPLFRRVRAEIERGDRDPWAISRNLGVDPWAVSSCLVELGDIDEANF